MNRLALIVPVVCFALGCTDKKGPAGETSPPPSPSASATGAAQPSAAEP